MNKRPGQLMEEDIRNLSIGSPLVFIYGDICPQGPDAPDVQVRCPTICEFKGISRDGWFKVGHLLLNGEEWEEERSLADCGARPYENGAWNQYNWVRIDV